MWFHHMASKDSSFSTLETKVCSEIWQGFNAAAFETICSCVTIYLRNVLQASAKVTAEREYEVLCAVA